jgi:hypothetical protein
MTTRQTICAIDRSAGQVSNLAASAAALILGTLLLLTRP